jgi:hypothetical protein
MAGIDKGFRSLRLLVWPVLLALRQARSRRVFRVSQFAVTAAPKDGWGAQSSHCGEIVSIFGSAKHFALRFVFDFADESKNMVPILRAVGGQADTACNTASSENFDFFGLPLSVQLHQSFFPNRSQVPQDSRSAPFCHPEGRVPSACAPKKIKDGRAGAPGCQLSKRLPAR